MFDTGGTPKYGTPKCASFSKSTITLIAIVCKRMTSACSSKKKIFKVLKSGLVLPCCFSALIPQPWLKAARPWSRMLASARLPQKLEEEGIVGHSLGRDNLRVFFDGDSAARTILELWPSPLRHNRGEEPTQIKGTIVEIAQPNSFVDTCPFFPLLLTFFRASLPLKVTVFRKAWKGWDSNPR
jgi:hypothetical protein